MLRAYSGKYDHEGAWRTYWRFDVAVAGIFSTATEPL